MRCMLDSSLLVMHKNLDCVVSFDSNTFSLMLGLPGCQRKHGSIEDSTEKCARRIEQWIEPRQETKWDS